MSYRTDLERTRDRLERTIPDVEAALRHAKDWISTHQPANLLGAQGGSSHPVAYEEHLEDRRVHALALHARTRIPELVRLVAHITTELEQLTIRCTAIVDHADLADDDGCISCARVQGCWNPIDPKRPGTRLCNWCANVQAGTGHLPPLEAVRLYHHQSPNAAGRYITRMAG